MEYAVFVYLESGYYYFGARYQDPKLGIFISVDPLAEKFAGWSSYAYANNNPLGFIDPTGMGPEDPPTIWGKIKTYVDYQWNTKIPNDLKKIGRELDNGWRVEANLKGGKAGGYDFRSSLSNGADSSGKVQKGRGSNNTQVVDITGLDILSTVVGFSTGTKTISKSGKVVDVLTDFAKAVKATPDGWTMGQNAGEMVNQATGQITMKLEEYSATSTDAWNKSQLDKKERDTTVNASQKSVINRMNKMNRTRAEQQKESNNNELQKKIDYYKQ